MKNMLLAVAVLALAGCATETDLRQTVPVMSGHSAKAVPVYAECVLDKWNNHTYLQPVVSKTTPDGISMQFVDSWAGPVFLLEVAKANGGSDFTLYRTKQISYYEDAITACK